MKNNSSNSIPVVVFRLPYAGTNGEQLLKHCLKKKKLCFKFEIKFRIIYNTGKYSFYFNVIDKIPYSIIYRLTWPGSGGKCIGKTERYLLLHIMKIVHRILERMFERMNISLNVNYVKNLVLITMSHILNVVLPNNAILDFEYTWPKSCKKLLFIVWLFTILTIHFILIFKRFHRYILALTFTYSFLE